MEQKPTISIDKPPVTRLTVNSRETKETIRKAAEATNRWGTAGNHTVFLRDITKRKRTSSNEDIRTPKKTRVEDTPKSRPKRGEVPRRGPDDGKTETRDEEKSRIGRARLDEEVDRREKLRKLKFDQLEARRAKLARQDKEDKETQAIIDKQGQKAGEVDTEKKTTGQSSVIRPFRALNEGADEEDNKSPALQKAGPQGKSESENDSEDPGVARKGESARDGTESEDSIELEFGPEIDQDYGEDYEYSEDDEEQGEPSEDPSPEREVIYKNTSTKNAGRNRRRRKQKQLARDQRLKPATARIPQNKRPGHKGAQI